LAVCVEYVIVNECTVESISVVKEHTHSCYGHFPVNLG